MPKINQLNSTLKADPEKWRETQRKSAEKYFKKVKAESFKKTKTKKRKQKPKNLSYYKKKLWKVFSQYIRLRDADKNGYCTCISCGKKMFWKKSQAGHFIPRSLSNFLYFNEKNVNAQCYRCNCILGGNLFEYAIALNKRYGEGTAMELREQKRELKKYTIQELKDLISFYSKKVKEMDIYDNS